MFKDNHKNILAATLLNRLYQRGKWGWAHMAFDKLVHGVPGHLRGDAKDVVDELIKVNYVLSKPTHYGLEVSLNSKMQKEILDLIYKYLPK